MKTFSSEKDLNILAAALHPPVSVDVCNFYYPGILVLGNLGFGRDSSACHVHIFFLSPGSG